MPHFGSTSIKRLGSCDQRLRRICYKAIQVYDFSVLEGYREEKEQDKLFKAKKSKLKYPDSKHNQVPSLAVDIVPFPIDWDCMSRFYFLAGIMFACAKEDNVQLRWGGDWNRDFNFRNQSFFDLPHFEIVE